MTSKFVPGHVYLDPSLPPSLRTILRESEPLTPDLAKKIALWGKDGDIVRLNQASFKKRQVYFCVWECLEGGEG